MVKILVKIKAFKNPYKILINPIKASVREGLF
jgi:hypothetical protein